MSTLEVPVRVGALASGGGSNLQAIIDASESGALPAKVVCVISNNSNAGSLARAEAHGIPTYHISSVTHPDDSERDAAIADALSRHGTQASCPVRLYEDARPGDAAKVLAVYPQHPPGPSAEVRRAKGCTACTSTKRS